MGITIDVLTTSAHPEMLPHWQWLLDRQTTDAEIVPHWSQARTKGDKNDRARSLAYLVTDSTADYFAMMDDDDHCDENWLARALDNIDGGMYGERCYRAYLLHKPAWGEMQTPRPEPFLTNMVFAKRHKRFALDLIFGKTKLTKREWPLSDGWVIMRGLMTSGDGITARKNRYTDKHWPHVDTDDRAKLREWVGDEAHEHYMGMLHADARGT